MYLFITFSFIIVPLALFTVLLVSLYGPLGAHMVEFMSWILANGMDLLAYLNLIPFVVWTAPELPNWVWPFSLIGVVLLLSPRGIPARWLGVLFLAPIMLIRPAGPDYGTVKLTVLDVGQGLALVIRTQRHTLLYDLGPRF
jgi:competence protein ComEC